MIRRIYILIFAGMVLVSCGKRYDEVVVYTTVDQIFSEPVLHDFEKETGIRVKALFDTEETKSTGVLNRLIAEGAHPQCDVFWSGDPVRAVILKQKGLSQAYRSPVARDIPVIFKDPDFQWTGFSARARVLIYNTRFLKDADVPRSIFDLAGEKYRGQAAIANPLFGTTTFHFAALFNLLGDEKARAFMEDLKKNGVVIATSNGDVRKRVSQGEVWCGLTDTDDAFAAKKEGSPVDFIFLDQDGMGTLVMPNTLVLIRNAPHQENGRRLIDYLLSGETEAKLARSAAQMPLHKGVTTPPDIPSLDDIKPMEIDYDETAKKMEEIQTFLKDLSERR